MKTKFHPFHSVRARWFSGVLRGQNGTDFFGYIMTYSEKFKDPRWQKRRLEIMDRDDFACRNCGDTDSPLHVHHANYEKGLEPWDYDDSQLVTFCADCHAALEARIKALRHDMATIPHKRLLVFFCKTEEEATEYENIFAQARSKKRKKK